METIYSALDTILKTIKSLDPNFNSMDMPGNVLDFHTFCLSISYGPTIFPPLDGKSDVKSKQTTFHAYCKGKFGNKKPALCGWGSKPRSERKYWDSLKPNN